MNKYLLNLRKLSFEINCISLIFLLTSCSFDNHKISESECRECDRELLKLDTYKKINENKISIIDSLFHNIQNLDSILSKRILRNHLIPADNNNKTKIVMDSQIDNFIEKSKCKNQSSKKSQLEPYLKWLKSAEMQCDNYLSRIQFYAKKDSAYRKMLDLELAPFEILFKTNNNSSNKDNSLFEIDYTKQLDTKIQKLIRQSYMISRSYDEINEYKDRK